MRAKQAGLFERGMAMFREITEELIKWKEKARRKPLLMLGVRQCGKTYVIKEFAKDYFKNYVYLNLNLKLKGYQ